jgi:hypothetical protein
MFDFDDVIAEAKWMVDMAKPALRAGFVADRKKRKKMLAFSGHEPKVEEALLRGVAEKEVNNGAGE